MCSSDDSGQTDVLWYSMKVTVEKFLVILRSLVRTMGILWSKREIGKDGAGKISNTWEKRKREKGKKGKILSSY